MNKGTIHYEYVNIENDWMKLAYKLAKNLYMQKKWNLKTSPVAIIVKDGKFVSHGICADGNHAIEGKCDRLETKGTSYDNCKYCMESEHAERKALQEGYDQDLNDAHIYVYGHYKLCDSCIAALNARGIYKCFLLENASELFDRHHANTVIGKPTQFSV